MVVLHRTVNQTTRSNYFSTLDALPLRFTLFIPPPPPPGHPPSQYKLQHLFVSLLVHVAHPNHLGIVLPVVFNSEYNTAECTMSYARNCTEIYVGALVRRSQRKRATRAAGRSGGLRPTIPSSQRELFGARVVKKWAKIRCCSNGNPGRRTDRESESPSFCCLTV